MIFTTKNNSLVDFRSRRRRLCLTTNLNKRSYFRRYLPVFSLLLVNNNNNLSHY